MFEVIRLRASARFQLKRQSRATAANQFPPMAALLTLGSALNAGDLGAGGSGGVSDDVATGQRVVDHIAAAFGRE